MTAISFPHSAPGIPEAADQSAHVRRAADEVVAGCVLLVFLAVEEKHPICFGYDQRQVVLHPLGFAFAPGPILFGRDPSGKDVWFNIGMMRDVRYRQEIESNDHARTPMRNVPVLARSAR